MPGPEDTFVAYGTGWANTSNTPFRGYKHDGYEGGISTPFIFHWPAGVPSERESAIIRDPCHLIDLMPTLVEATGAAYPAEFGGERIQPMEAIKDDPPLPVLKQLKRVVEIRFPDPPGMKRVAVWVVEYVPRPKVEEWFRRLRRPERQVEKPRQRGDSHLGDRRFNRPHLLVVPVAVRPDPAKMLGSH